MNLKAMWNHWRTLGDVGDGLMVNPVALVIPLICSAAAIGHFGQPLQEMLGDLWFALILIVLSLVSGIFLAWATTPFWGMYYLRQIEADFGPQTRAHVFRWFLARRSVEQETLNIDAFALKCGEHPARKSIQ